MGCNVLDVVAELLDVEPERRQHHPAWLGLSDSQRQEAAEMLGMEDRGREFLSGALTFVAGQIVGDLRGGRRQALAQAGDTFGEYRLVRRLAGGTFGEVWVANHESLDSEEAIPTCLKILYPETARAEDVRREARAMRGILHPNVVAVKRAGVALLNGEALSYIEMDLVGELGRDGQFRVGRSLAKAGVHRRGLPKLPARKAGQVVAAVCRGVQAAHDRNRIHCDLKPENIIVEPFSLTPKVTDFGTAAILEKLSEAGEDSQIRGTPAYMAPEQLGGKVGVASDIYSLGGVLYYLLAGHPPYRARRGVAARMATTEILNKLRSGEAPEPLPDSSRVPTTLSRICRKAMSRLPAQRYATAGDMADDIEAFLAYRPTSVDPPGRVQAIMRACRRQRVTVTMGRWLGALRRAPGWLYAPLAAQRRESHRYLAAVREIFASAQPLDTMLTYARQWTGADGGTIYICREGGLELSVVQNDTLQARGAAPDLPRSRIVLSDESIVGYVARRKRPLNLPDAYRIDPALGLRHNASFDSKYGYRTTSILTIPLVDEAEEVIGVLQLLNRKAPGGRFIPFRSADVQTVSTLAQWASAQLSKARGDPTSSEPSAARPSPIYNAV